MLDRRDLKKVYKDTVDKCSNGKYSKLPHGKSSKYSSQDLKNIKLEPLFDETVIEVINEDTFVVCDQLLKTDNDVCALNMASYLRPGGGVENGSMAQEEELFRRSNYFLTLKPSFYPLNYSEVIYSNCVYIIKDKSYIDIQEPKKVSMIAAAALKYPDLTDDKLSYYNQKDYDTMRNTINNIFKVAYINGHKTLVLGAIGCGAYANPVTQIIKIFNECLEKYNKCFKRIVFAVFSRKDKNFDKFNEFIIRKLN